MNDTGTGSTSMSDPGRTRGEPGAPTAQGRASAFRKPPEPRDLDPGLVTEDLGQRPPLRSSVNGRSVVLSFEEARQRFHACQFSWLLPLDEYRWKMGKYAGSILLCSRVRPAPRRLGLLMHVRGNRRLTQAALEEHEGVEIMEKNAFHARAAKWNVIYGDMPADLRPFFYYEFEDLRGIRYPAYQMRRDIKYIVVIGAADGTPDDLVDWEYFLADPASG